MTKREYNGWSSYETWNVKLWIDNDEGSQNYWREQTEEAWKEARAGSILTRQENVRLALAKQLQSEHEDISHNCLEGNSNMSASWVADLLSAALSEVDWHEIADSLLTDHVEDYGKVERAA